MLWCTTREGDVLHIDPLSGAYETVLSLNVNDGGVEPGLLGMALHPEWDTTPKVYLAYTAFGNQERLSVFDWGTVRRWATKKSCIPSVPQASTTEAACWSCPTTRCS